MKTIFNKSFIIAMLALLISACSGDKTFNDYARAGDTVAVAAGWKQNFNKENITVTITPSVGSVITILPGDPAIRASINFYADPLSSGIVSRETGIEFSKYALTYESTITSNYTKKDKDWYQTSVFIDLPATLPVGATQIEITNPQGLSVTSMVEIIDGIGSPSTFTAQNNTNLSTDMLDALTRVEHYSINFSAIDLLPYAIEITLQHDPDVDSGGIGKALAVNPLGYKKNLVWKDDGINMKVILMPTNDAKPMDNINDFKFYVAGNVQNLAIATVKAFDINGNFVTGISATSILGR